MTRTAVRKREWCRQHGGGQPLSECYPWDRHNHSNRFREDDWTATESAAEDAGLPTTTELIAHGMEAMQDFLRCDRGDCYMGGPPVPVIWGDLTGRPLGAWITEAVKEIRRQHPRHQPVRIGAAAPIRADATCLRCDAPWSADHVCEAGADTPAPAVFMEPAVKS
jgi:hypothetical protein